jgi:hypothetical protein
MDSISFYWIVQNRLQKPTTAPRFLLVDNATSPPAQGTYAYGLSDLASFAATVGKGPTRTSLSLTTELVSNTNETGAGHLSDASFNRTSLAADFGRAGLGFVTSLPWAVSEIRKP